MNLILNCLEIVTVLHGFCQGILGLHGFLNPIWTKIVSSILILLAFFLFL